MSGSPEARAAQLNPIGPYVGVSDCYDKASCYAETEIWFSMVEHTPGTYENCHNVGTHGPYLGGQNTWAFEGLVNCTQISNGNLVGRALAFYAPFGSWEPECDQGGTNPPNPPVCPPPPGYVAVPSLDPCPLEPENRNPDESNPCNPASGNKRQTEVDYASSAEGGVSFARLYNSQGAFKTGQGMGIGWRHTYSRELDEEPDRAGTLGYILPAIRSSVYSTASEACTLGWDDIKTKIYGGDLSTATPVFVGGNTCRIDSGGSTVAYIDIRSNEPLPIALPLGWKVVSRPSGARIIFRKIGGNWVSELNPSFALAESGSNWIFTDTNDTEETYDSSDRLISITKRNGQVTTLDHDVSVALGGDGDSSTLDKVTGPFGHSISLSYNASGQLASVASPDGTVQYAYDTDEHLTTVTYPDTNTRQYHYEELLFPDHLTGITDENTDRFATWEYGIEGRAIRSEHAGGKEKVEYTYNPNGSTTVNTAAGATRTYVYTTEQGSRKLATITGDVCSTCPGGHISGRSYDSNGFLDEATDWNDGVTQTIRNSRGLTETRIEGKGTGLARTMTATWHAGFRLPLTVDTPKNTTTYVYDSDGNVLSMTVTAGALSRAWTFTYNSDGQVLTLDGPRTDVTDVTTLTYNTCTTGSQCGQVATVTNALGQVTTYNSYDASGRVTLITDATGLQTANSYDTDGNVLSVTRTPTVGAAEVTTMTYDDVGQLLTLTSPLAVTLTYSYDAAHYVTSVTDNLGNKIEYDYDAMGNLIDEKTYDPLSALKRQMQYTYDVNNQIDTVIDGSITSDLMVDLVGNLTSDVDGNSNTTASTYDVFNRLDTVTDALSGVLDYDYDVHNNVTQAVAANGATTNYVYDDLDNLSSETSPDRGLTSYTYDDAGNRLTAIDARGITATYTYDILNRVKTESFPDTAENIVYTYDGSGGNETGRLTSIADQSGTTTYTYDGFGRVASDTRLISGVSYVTSYQYDADGNTTSITYPSGRAVSYTRNALGQITQVASNKGGVSKSIVTAADYEPFGPLSGLTYGNGLAVDYDYGNDYRLSDIDAAGKIDRAYGYDSAGNIASILDGIDNAKGEAFAYDALNRLTSETWQQSVSYSGQVLADSPVAYWRLGESSGTIATDATGNSNDGTYAGTVTHADPGLIFGNDTGMGIDTAGSSYMVGPTFTGTSITGIDAWMQTDSYTAHRWVVSLYTSNSSRFLIGHRNNGTVVVFRETGFQLISDGAVSSNEAHHIAVWYEPGTNKTYMMIDGVTQQNTYTGNLLGLTDPRLDLGGYRYSGSVTPNYLGSIDEVAVYDTAVTAATFSGRYAAGSASGGAANNFTYDANGNRLTLDDGTVETLTYQAASNRLATIGGSSLTHDAAGNRTGSPGGSTTYGYDDSGRLDTVTSGGGTIATYVHNALGQRTKKTVGGSDTFYIYDLSGQLISEHDATGVLIRDYVWLGGAPAAQVDAGETFSYINFDHLGTPRTATDDSQTIVWRWDGDAFGSTAPNEDPDGNSTTVTLNLRYPGQYFDGETGFHYNYFRTYDPSTGRYLESDPIGLSGGLNTYGYANQNPLTNFDPSGLATVAGCANPINAAACAAAGILVTGSAVIIVSQNSEAISDAVSEICEIPEGYFDLLGIGGSSPASPPPPDDPFDADGTDKKLPKNLRTKFRKIESATRQGGNTRVTGRVTQSEAQQLAERFVGPNARVPKTSNGVTYYRSGDGLRQARGPSFKPTDAGRNVHPTSGQPYSNTGYQMNFETRLVPQGRYSHSNVHLDVAP